MASGIYVSLLTRSRDDGGAARCRWFNGVSFEGCVHGGCASLTRPTSFRCRIFRRVGKRSAPTIAKKRRPMALRGKYLRPVNGSIRQHDAFLCNLPSRERVKGARRRPLNNPGSRQNGSRRENIRHPRIHSVSVGRVSAAHLPC